MMTGRKGKERISKSIVSFFLSHIHHPICLLLMLNIMFANLLKEIMFQGSKERHKRVPCQECGDTFTSNKIDRHMHTHQKTKCSECNAVVKQSYMKRHMKRHEKFVNCENCHRDVAERKFAQHLILCNSKVDHNLCDRNNVEMLPCASSSVNGYFKRWEIPIEKVENYDDMLQELGEKLKIMLGNLLQTDPLKVQVIITVGFNHDHVDEGSVYTEVTFRTICEPILLGDSLDEYISRVKDQHRLSIESFERLASGWVYECLMAAFLDGAKYKPLTAGSYIKLPKRLTRSTVNIRAPDNRCLLYCLIAKKCLVDDQDAIEKAKAAKLPMPTTNKFPKMGHRNKHSAYTIYENEINMTGIIYPVRLADIGKVEVNNDLSISVFEWDFKEACVIPLRHGRGQGTPVELLYLEKNEMSHFALIRNFHAFMRIRTKHHHSKYFCMKCLFGYITPEKLEEHKKVCGQRLHQTTRMPQPGNIKFESHWKGIRKLFCIYADFETILTPIQGADRDPNPLKSAKERQSHTDLKQLHETCSYSIVSISEFEDYEVETSVYSNANPRLVSQMFIAKLDLIHANMMKCYQDNTFAIDMSLEDEFAFQRTTHCHICKLKINNKSKSQYAVRDHDHFKKTSNFRGGAHNSCNLNYWERTKKVVVYFHNMAYDLNNFLVDLIKSTADEKDINIIPENLERFKAIYVKKFIFMDTFNFLASSLETLVKNLAEKGAHNFKQLRHHFPVHYELLMQKGIYCYDYVSCYDVFLETSLPPKESFDNALNESVISDEDYAMAQRVWSEMNCQTFGDYMRIYVLVDSLLLCDVFESFRDLCMSHYMLDPSHYMSLPAIGYDAMLKMTGVQIEKMVDIDMYSFLFDNLRGGVTTISQRLARANNPYLLDYNEDEATTFIQYLDVNNL